MKKFLFVPVVLVLLCGVFTTDASAQAANGFRRFDLNWNASYNRQGSVNQYGGSLSFGAHLNERWAIVGDVDLHEPSDNSFRTTTYRFGPRMTRRMGERVTTFTHFLVGGAHLSVPSLGSSSPTANGFAMLAGGGLDIGIKPWFGIRALDGGYSGLHFSGGGWSHGMRLAGGVVFRFGSE
jgi:hypothetical protein